MANDNIYFPLPLQITRVSMSWLSMNKDMVSPWKHTLLELHYRWDCWKLVKWKLPNRPPFIRQLKPEKRMGRVMWRKSYLRQLFRLIALRKAEAYTLPQMWNCVILLMCAKCLSWMWADNLILDMFVRRSQSTNWLILSVFHLLIGMREVINTRVPAIHCTFLTDKEIICAVISPYFETPPKWHTLCDTQKYVE